MKTKCVDKAGNVLRVYDYEMKQVLIGADFCIGQDLHVVLKITRDEAGGFVVLEVVRKPTP